MISMMLKSRDGPDDPADAALLLSQGFAKQYISQH
jgi:hypothetical protein